MNTGRESVTGWLASSEGPGWYIRAAEAPTAAGRPFIGLLIEDTPMQIFDSLVAILGIILYMLVLFVLSFGIWLVITGGVGLLGGVLSVPALYVLPDVRRFLVQASGGQPDGETPSWRVVLRPRYLLLSIGFGIVYGVAFLALFIPFSWFGLFPRSWRADPVGSAPAGGVHPGEHAVRLHGPPPLIGVDWNDVEAIGAKPVAGLSRSRRHHRDRYPIRVHPHVAVLRRRTPTLADRTAQ